MRVLGFVASVGLAVGAGNRIRELRNAIMNRHIPPPVLDADGNPVEKTWAEIRHEHEELAAPTLPPLSGEIIQPKMDYDQHTHFEFADIYQNTPTIHCGDEPCGYGTDVYHEPTEGYGHGDYGHPHFRQVRNYGDGVQGHYFPDGTGHAYHGHPEYNGHPDDHHDCHGHHDCDPHAGHATWNHADHQGPAPDSVRYFKGHAADAHFENGREFPHDVNAPSMNQLLHPLPVIPKAPFGPDSMDWTRPVMLVKHYEGEGAVEPVTPPYLLADPQNTANDYAN